MTPMTDLPTTATRPAIRDLARRLATPEGVHFAGLGVAAVVLLVAATRSWLFFDDFAFVVPSQEQNIWSPHVGHWSTTPFLVFLALRGLFGLDSFIPFAIPVIVAHLVFVHLVWRLMRKVGVAPWIATALGLLLTFFGAGGENILWAFQIGFIGAMAFALGVILILMRPRLRPLDVVAVIALSLLAVSSSGTALPLLGVAGIVGWMRHGFLRTAGLFVIPAVAYLAWYLMLGRFAPSTGRASGFAELLLRVPAYAIEMLTEGWGRVLPVTVVGPLLFVGIAIWWVFSIRTATADARVALVVSLAAPIFALLTAYSRVGLGIETAPSSRYLYFVIPMMIPVVGLMITQLLTRFDLALAPVLAIIGVVVLYNMGGLVGTLVERMVRAGEARQQFSAILDLQDDYDFTSAADGDRVPALRWAPDALLSDVEIWQERGWLSIAPYSASAELTARAVLGLGSEDAAEPAEDAVCRDLEPGDAPMTVDGSEVLVGPGAASIRIGLTDGTATGDPRPMGLSDGWTLVELDGPRSSSLDLVLEPSSVDVEVCTL